MRKQVVQASRRGEGELASSEERRSFLVSTSQHLLDILHLSFLQLQRSICGRLIIP